MLHLSEPRQPRGRPLIAHRPEQGDVTESPPNRKTFRIQARAIRRCGELLKQFDGKGNNQHGEGALPTQRQAAADAGMSVHQQKQAVRVANVPTEQFETLLFQ